MTTWISFDWLQYHIIILVKDLFATKYILNNFKDIGKIIN